MMSTVPPRKIYETEAEAEEALALSRLMRHRARAVIPPAQPFRNRIHTVMAPYTKDEKGPGLPQIKARWNDLVGEKLSGMSAPVKLTGKGMDRVLTLEILPAAAPLFQHQSETLRQKLSMACGGEIKSLKFIQRAPVKTSAKRRRPLSAQDRERLVADLSGIKNKQLSAALLAFGEAIYTQDD